MNQNHKTGSVDAAPTYVLQALGKRALVAVLDGQRGPVRQHLGNLSPPLGGRRNRRDPSEDYRILGRKRMESGSGEQA